MAAPADATGAEMELIAAIDLLGGRARRLVQGDYARPLETSADPLSLARDWLSAGIPRLHIVDIDGAREGRLVHLEMVAQMCALAREVSPSARIDFGGGLRDAASTESVLTAGVDDALLGSAAIRDPRFLASCAARWPGRVGVSLDLRDGRPQVAGWTNEVEDNALELAERLLAAGAARLQVTDIARDGTNQGPNLELMDMFRRRFPEVTLVAAGGVATTDDLAALAGIGVDGAIVGRALLDGSLDVPEALAACASEVAA
jgi:phosphoribosylformimino-5-aminoimidazole carboxamide ribotide isomerase